MQKKYFDGVVQSGDVTDAIDEDLKKTALESVGKVASSMDAFCIADAVETVVNLAKRSNKYIDETAPWALAKDESKKARLGTVLYNLLESIRFIAVELQPYMPETAEKIFSQINCDEKSYDSLKAFGALKAGTVVNDPTPLFNRIDAEKMLKEIEEEIAANEEKTEEPAGVMIGIDDFAKVELRVAEVKDCEPIPRAKKLLKLTLDDGSGKPRTVASGIAQWYKPEDLIGKKVVVVANLKPAVLCGVESQGMILAADCSENDVKVVFVDGMPNGAKIR
jgi:methionyl-tRNA synthetase